MILLVRDHPRCAMSASGIGERPNRGGFVCLHREEVIKTSDSQNADYTDGRIEQFEQAALSLDSIKGGNQFSDAGTVDVGDIRQVEEYLASSLVEYVAYDLANQQWSRTLGGLSMCQRLAKCDGSL